MVNGPRKLGGWGGCHSCTVLGSEEIELHITRLYRCRVPLKPHTSCTVLGPAQIELYITRLYRHRVLLKPRTTASRTHSDPEMEFNTTRP